MTGFITERDKVTGADIAKMNEIASELGLYGAGEEPQINFSSAPSPDEEKEKDE